MITQKLNLSKRTIYQSLYLISMALYHSIQFSTLATDSGTDNQNKVNFLFSIINNINIPQISYLLIFISTIMIASIAIKTYYLSTENYFLQIVDRVFFPLQLYVMAKLMIEYRQGTESFSQQLVIWMLICTVVNAAILIIKNVKFTFRFADFREMAFARLVTFQYVILISKIVITLILSIFLPNNFAIQIIAVVSFNFIINLIFAFNVIYQHPNVEYLCLLTQFYLWIPVVSMIFSYNSHNSLATLAFNSVSFVFYLTLSFIKPQILINLLEKKYSRCFQKFNHQVNSPNSQEMRSFATNLIAILSVYISLFFQNSTNQPKLSWSDTFKSQLVDFIQQKGIKQNIEVFNSTLVNFKSIQQQKNTFQQKKSPLTLEKARKVSTTIKDSRKVSILPQSQSVKVDLLQEVRNRLKTSQKSEQQQNTQHRDFVYEFLWNLVYPYISSTENNFNNLRFYVSYAFPDKLKNMKFRLFYSFYFNNFEQLDFCSRIEGKICYNYLTTLIGNQLSDQRFFGQFEQNLKRQQQKDCLLEQNGYHHQKFNDLMKEREIHEEILNGFQKFCLNQELYIKIFQNIKQQKQTIRQYYKTRQQLRVTIQQSLQDYENLKNKNKYFQIMAKYMKDYFLHKNECTAYINFKTEHFKLNIQKRHYLRQSISNNNDQMTFRQKITYSIKCNSLLNKANDNLICVVSGIKQLGVIQMSSPKFKQLMEISFSELDGEMESNVKHMNHFNLPFWRDKHNEQMRKVEFFEKPADHEEKRYFIISHKSNNLLDVKFKMYFFVKYETDLLLVLDIQYQKMDYLQVRNHKQEILYNYRSQNNILCSNINKLNKNSNTSLTNSTQSQQFQQQHYDIENVQLFETFYQIKTLKYQNPKIHALNKFLFKSRSKKEIIRQKKFQENLILSEKVMLEKKFAMFKRNFNIYEKLWNVIRVVVIGSILFFLVAFQMLKMNESSDQNQALNFILNKMSIQNKIVFLETYSAIEIGVLNELVQGRILFDNPSKKTQFLAQIFDSLVLLKKEINEMSDLTLFDRSHTQLVQSLYQADWIPGYNISLIVFSLISQKLFDESLSVFIDPLILTDSNQILQLSNMLTLKQQTIIQQKIFNTISANNYYFNPNGMMDQISILESQLFSRNSSVRTLLFVIVQFGFTIFSILVIFFIIKLKKSILQHYNKALLVSIMFRKNFQSKLAKFRKFINQLKICSQGDLSQKIQPQKILCQIDSRKLTYVRRYTGEGLKTSIWNKNERFQEEEAKLNLFKYLFESVLFPFLRYFIIVGSVFHIYQSNVQNSSILQQYSNSLNILGRLNVDFMMSFGVNLYYKEFASNNTMIEELTAEFLRCQKQLRKIDKVETINGLFPFNPEIAYSILYESSEVSLQKLGIELSIFKSQKSFLQDTNQLLFLQKALFKHLQNNRTTLNDMKKHLIESYEKVSHLYWFLNNITVKSYELIDYQIKTNDTDWFIGLMIFLCIEFMMGSMHFIQILDNFNNEYLNLSTYEQMKRQVVFSRFVNLSAKQSSIEIDKNTDGLTER